MQDGGSAALAGFRMERRVAAIYRALGAEVQHDVGVAGNQIDLLVRERVASGATVTTAIECKAYSRPVGVEIVNAFGAIAYLLKHRSLIERAAIVATAGFTRRARDAAQTHGVDLVDLADLEQRARDRHATVVDEEPEPQKGDTPAESRQPKRIFVLMPFAPAFQDVYILGIREVAEKLGLIVERADDVEHNGEIMEIVREKIRSADGIVADATGRNANVFYEMGYAHALERPTILIARTGDVIPFDVRAINFILFETIVELRNRLEKRLRETVLREGTAT